MHEPLDSRFCPRSVGYLDQVFRPLCSFFLVPRWSYDPRCLCCERFSDSSHVSKSGCRPRLWRMQRQRSPLAHVHSHTACSLSSEPFLSGSGYLAEHSLFLIYLYLISTTSQCSKDYHHTHSTNEKTVA